MKVLMLSAGITDCRCITPSDSSLADAFRDAEKNLALEAARVIMNFKR